MGNVRFSNSFCSYDKVARIKEPNHKLKGFNACKQASDNDAAFRVGILQGKLEDLRAIKKTYVTDTKN